MWHWRKRARRGDMPPWRDEFNELARYNGERGRGIMHTPEHRARMERLQAEFDDEIQRWHRDRGDIVIG